MGAIHDYSLFVDDYDVTVDTLRTYAHLFYEEIESVGDSWQADLNQLVAQMYGKLSYDHLSDEEIATLVISYESALIIEGVLNLEESEETE